MRVAVLVPFAVIGFVVLLGAVFHTWVLGRVDGFHQWQSGFGAAKTPAEAMEKFRAAIQQRRYRWAASYCTRDYAEVLTKSDAAASRLGQVIDDVQGYMKNRELQSDRGQLLLHCLDPFPATFEVVGEPQPSGPDGAVGFFRWNPLALKGSSAGFAGDMANLESKMFQRALMAPELFSAKGVKLAREADGWKLSVLPNAATLASVTWFLDRAPAYISALGEFRTFMTNGRYDSAAAFDREVFDALRKANPSVR